MKFAKTKFALSALCIASLAACGGGGDSTPAGGQATALSTAPECTIGGVTYGEHLIVPDTCKQIGTLFQQAVDAQTKSAADLATANAALTKAMADLKAAQADAGAKATQIADLTTKLNTANANLKIANDAVTAANATIKSLQDTIAASTDAQQIVALQASLTKAQSDLATAQAQAAADQATITKAAADLAAAVNANSAQAAQLNQAAADLAAANGQVAALQTQLAAAQGNVTDLQAQLATANTNLAKAQADLATAQAALAASGDANTILAAAKVVAAQAEADKAAAAADAAQAAADKAAAQADSIQAATAQAAAAQALADAKTEHDTATALAAQAAADKAAADAAAATAAADKASAQALADQAAADKAAALAALAEAQALSNATGLPLCTYTAGTPFNWSAVGDTCVLTFAMQKQIQDDIKAAAAAFKFEGVYSAPNAYVVAEVGGKIWLTDEANNVTDAAQIATSNGTSFLGTGEDISYLHTAVTVTGAYAEGSPNAGVTVDYGTAPGFTKTTFEVSAITQPNPLVIAATALNGENGFSNDGGDVALTVAADGTFTGTEGATCTFSGKFDVTGSPYEKVTIKFANRVDGAATQVCTTNKLGQTATGVIAVRDGSYLIMAELPGAFGKEGFGGYFTAPVTKAAAVGRAKALSVKASKGQSTGLAFLNAVGSK